MKARWMLLAAALMPALAQADLTLVLEDTNKAGETTTLRIAHGMVRLESGPRDYAIYDAARDTLIIVDGAAGSYTPLTRRDLAEMGGMMRQMQAMLQSLPPEQRALAMQQMPPGMQGNAGPVQTRRVGEDRIQGIACTRYRLRRGGQRLGEVCMAGFQALKLAARDSRAVRGLWKMMYDLNRQMQTIEGLDPLLASNLPGLPLELRDDVAGEDFRLKSVSRKAVPRSLFEDYKRLRRETLNRPSPGGRPPAE